MIYRMKTDVHISVARCTDYDCNMVKENSLWILCNILGVFVARIGDYFMAKFNRYPLFDLSVTSQWTHITWNLCTLMPVSNTALWNFVLLVAEGCWKNFPKFETNDIICIYKILFRNFPDRPHKLVKKLWKNFGETFDTFLKNLEKF